MTIETISNIVDTLKKLLDDPHPGLISWNIALENQIDKLQRPILPFECPDCDAQLELQEGKIVFLEHRI